METHEGKQLEKWLHQTGISPETLGLTLGVSKQTIYYHINKGRIADSFKHKLSNAGVNVFDLPVKQAKQVGLPVFDIYGRAGKSSLVNTMENSETTAYVSVPGYEDCLGWVRVKGDSMSPYLNSGDFIALKKVNLDMVLYGHVYFIEFSGDFAPEPVVKYIRKGSTPDYITLRSHNEKYEDTEIPKKSIKDIYAVRGGIIEIQ